MESVTNFSDEGSFSGDVVRIDEGKLRGHVDQVVRASVEETLNGLLEAEADQLCNAKRYERTPDRVDTRAGSYERQLLTKDGFATPEFAAAWMAEIERRLVAYDRGKVQAVPAGVALDKMRQRLAAFRAAKATT
ncbi:transposase [bacterium]|nr:transposase [bacterium]